MNMNIIGKEINSPALKEIATSMHDLICRIQSDEISHQQGATEITGHKHLIQSIALDWAFNRKKQELLPHIEGELV